MCSIFGQQEARSLQESASNLGGQLLGKCQHFYDLYAGVIYRNDARVRSYNLLNILLTLF